MNRKDLLDKIKQHQIEIENGWIQRYDKEDIVVMLSRIAEDLNNISETN